MLILENLFHIESICKSDTSLNVRLKKILFFNFNPNDEQHPQPYFLRRKTKTDKRTIRRVPDKRFDLENFSLSGFQNTRMNPNTNESVVFQGLSGLLRSHVLTPIVNYLGTRNAMQGQVTVDELANILRLPASAAIPQAPMAMQPQLGVQPQMGMQQGAMPGLFGLTGLTGFAGAQPATKAKSGKAAEPVPANERCQYVMSRGQNAGRQCEKRAAPGNVFCTTCSGKKAAATQIAGKGGVPMMGGGLPGFQQPGLVGMNPAMGAQLTAAPQSSVGQLQVTSLGNGMFYDPRNYLLLRSGNNPNEIICIGLYDPATRQQLPLTPEKMQVCQSMGISYVNPNQGQVPQTAGASAGLSGLPGLAQQGTVSSAPIGTLTGLPSVGHSLPQAGALPGQLPSVTGGFPGQLPSLGGQPAIGGFPGQLPALGGQSSMGSLPGQLPTMGQTIPQGIPSLGGLPTTGQNPLSVPGSFPTMGVPVMGGLPL